MYATDNRRMPKKPRRWAWYVGTGGHLELRDEDKQLVVRAEYWRGNETGTSVLTPPHGKPAPDGRVRVSTREAVLLATAPELVECIDGLLESVIDCLGVGCLHDDQEDYEDDCWVCHARCLLGRMS